MSLKLRPKQALKWIMLILMAFPAGISIYMPRSGTLLLLCLGVVLLMLLTYKVFIRKKKKILSFHYFIIAFSVIVVTCTLINNGDTLRAIKLIYKLFLGAVWAYGYMSDDYWDTIHVLATWGKILLVLNFIFAFIFPNGIYVAENSNGSACAFLENINNMEVFWIPFSVFWISDIVHQKKNLVIGRILAIYAMILYTSYVYNCQTGLIIAFIMLMSAMWIVSVKQKLFDKIPIQLIVVILTVVMGLIISTGGNAFSFLSSQDSFVARIQLWTNALNMISKRPLVGYGVLDNDYVIYYNQWRNYSAHNQYLMIGIWGGLPLMICFILLIIVAARHCSSHRDTHFALYNLAIIGFMVYYLVEITFDMSMFVVLFSALVLYPGENRMLNRRLL